MRGCGPRCISAGDPQMIARFEQLIGTWELVSYRVIGQDSSLRFPLGPDASGFIIYTSDGYMSAQLMRAGRVPYVSNDLHAGSTAEMSAAAAGYIAYSGPFSIDEANGLVKHHVSVCLFPNWLGNTQARICKLDHDSLTLRTTSPLPIDGVLATPTIEWRRAARQR